MLDLRKYLIAAVMLFGANAIAQSPVNDDPVAFLADQGFPSSSYSILLTWQHDAPGGAVHGFHLQSLQSQSTLDLYFTEDGTPLTPADRQRLGIPEKNWNPSPRSAPLEFALSRKVANAQPPVPATTSAGIAPSALVALPEVDLATILAEDEANRISGQKQGKRIAVIHEFDTPIVVQGPSVSEGTWVTLPNGDQVWSIVVNSPGAIGQRLRLSELTLPTGASVIVYDAFETEESYGPYSGLHTRSDVRWTSTCFSDTVVLECVVPAGADINDVSLQLDQSTHVYVSAEELLPKVGNCHNDVTCFATWADAASGVVGIGGVSLGCTGTLIADENASTQGPYTLSADHCGFSSDSSAANLEFYWFYQSDSCNGTVPQLSSVPRSSGSDYLASSNVSTGTDFVLLQLDEQPPVGVAFVGWSSEPKAVGTDTTCIHHPSGSFKRISFAAITDVDESSRDIRPITRFHQASWTSGVTEPGSSGSPLFDENTQEIIGQLWGGPSSCSAVGNNRLDYYGRFDVTFPLIEQFLSAFDGPEDIDANGGVNATDVQLVINAALSIPIAFDADVNASGDVDAVDVQLVINAALG